MLQWLQANQARTVTLFRKLDQDNDGRLKAEDFDIGMRSLDVHITISIIFDILLFKDDSLSLCVSFLKLCRFQLQKQRYKS